MNPRSKTIRRWVEFVLRLVVPAAAVIAATFPELFFGEPVSLESLLRLTLGLIAAGAITSALERYGILSEIESEVSLIRELSNVEFLHSAQDAGVVDLYPRRIIIASPAWLTPLNTPPAIWMCVEWPGRSYSGTIN